MHRHYLYRMAILAHGSSLLRDPSDDLAELANVRNHRIANYNFAGHWGRKPILPNDIELLQLIKNHLPADENDYKIRIEEPYIQFYSKSDLL